MQILQKDLKIKLFLIAFSADYYYFCEIVNK